MTWGGQHNQRIMNRLKISKQGFYIGMLDMLDPFAMAMDTEATVPQEMSRELKQTLSIMNKIYKKTTLTIKYPERFLPRNASQRFWEEVAALIDAGVAVTAETSDVVAAGWVKWDEVRVEGPNEDNPGTLMEYNPGPTYGRDISHLMENIYF